jgi:hypothetical protein
VESRAAAATRDSTNRFRSQQPLGRASRDFAGTYRAAGYGTIVVDSRGTELRYRWGAVRGTLIPADLTAMRFTVDVAGAEMSLQFDLPGTGAARSLRMNGTRFTRTR